MEDKERKREADEIQKRKKDELGMRILENCRNELYLYYPYLDGAFASLLGKPAEDISGIGTDGRNIRFCSDSLLKQYLQSPVSVRRGYLHMLLHCLYLHPFRETGEDIQTWNLACDMVVEQIIEQEKALCVEEEKNEVKQECLKFLGSKALPAEEICRKIKDGRFPYPMEEMAAAFYFDAHEIWSRHSGNSADLRKKWAEILRYTTRGKTEHKRRIGTEKGTKTEEMGEISKGRYDYKKFLKQFAFPREEVEIDTESFDYIFYHFGMEQYGDMPLIEPLEYKEVNRLEELVIAIDTSGSCSKEMVRRFLKETYEILSDRENFFKKMKVYLIQCDCFIQNVTVLHSEEEWKEYAKNIRIEGRSGTDFRPVFDYVRTLQNKKELRNVKALIYFTDGDGIYPRERTEYETAFVFLEKTDAMERVPPWARCLVKGDIYEHP